MYCVVDEAGQDAIQHLENTHYVKIGKVRIGSVGTDAGSKGELCILLYRISNPKKLSIFAADKIHCIPAILTTCSEGAGDEAFWEFARQMAQRKIAFVEAQYKGIDVVLH